jgi:hypothetical protein
MYTVFSGGKKRMMQRRNDSAQDFDLGSDGLPLDFYIDGGHADTKVIRSQSRFHFQSRIAQLSRADYDGIMRQLGNTRTPGTNDASRDYLLMGKGRTSIGYVVGESANRYVSSPPVIGRARYVREIYGVQFAAAIGRAYAGLAPTLNANGLRVIASHASRDSEFAGDLEDALVGRWDFEVAGERFQFEVEDVQTYEEPFGGYCNMAIMYDWNKRTYVYPFIGKNVGMLDSGGGTSGSIAVLKGGVIDYTTAASTGQGVNNVLERLRTAIKAKHGNKFKQVAEIPWSALQKALKTGTFTIAGRDIDVHSLVKEALAPLINDITNLWVTRLGAGAELDMLGLTGGGMFLIGEQIAEAIDFPREKIFYAKTDKDSDGHQSVSEDLRFANVEGAKKFFEALTAETGR